MAPHITEIIFRRLNLVSNEIKIKQQSKGLMYNTKEILFYLERDWALRQIKMILIRGLTKNMH